MLVEHRGHSPEVDPSAWVAPNAVLSGAVSVGPGARILYGAVLTAEGAELSVGRECVIMEQAVLRASGRFSLRIGEHTLVGPHAYLTGCTVGPRCFIATGAMIFNGASLGEACTVALSGKVHIDTELEDNAWVPMEHIAFGRPGRIYAPDEAPQVHSEMARLSFPRYVFAIEPEGKSRAEIMDEMLSRYTRSLGHHAEDAILDP